MADDLVCKLEKARAAAAMYEEHYAKIRAALDGEEKP